MLATSTALLCVLLTQVFEVTALPFDQPEARCFIAEWNGDDNGDFFVLDGNILKVLATGPEGPLDIIRLDEGVSAFDIVDTNNDELSEVIAISGNNILLYQHPVSPNSDETEVTPPKILLSIETHFSENVARPFPYVLTVQRDNVTLLSLPTDDGVELRSLDGALVKILPVNDPANALHGYTESFSGLALPSSEPGLRQTLEFRVNRLLAPNPFLTEAPIDPPMRRGTPRQAREAEHLGPDAWPWFALRKDDLQAGRALFALTGPQHFETSVRIRAPISEEAGTPQNLRLGPPRRYPGALIAGASELPDFNGDGFVDLILWKAPRPVPTVDAVTKALMGGDWPIRITVHLYSEESGRFAPRPVDFMEQRVPFTQILLGNNGTVPLRMVVMEDFNGDGRTDFACATNPDTYEVWLFGEDGFDDTPNFHQTFSEPIVSIAFRADLAGNGKTSLGLRGERTLYVLKATN